MLEGFKSYRRNWDVGGGDGELEDGLCAEGEDEPLIGTEVLEELWFPKGMRYSEGTWVLRERLERVCEGQGS